MSSTQLLSLAGSFLRNKESGGTESKGAHCPAENDGRALLGGSLLIFLLFMAEPGFEL